MKFQLRDIKPNPFRHMERYPLDDEKIEILQESIKKTGFWDNIVARKNGDKAEIAYGHHRLHALKKMYPGTHEVDLIIRKLDSEHMIKMMADENLEFWGGTAQVVMETIRAVIQAAADREIKLPEIKQLPQRLGDGSVRLAPSFSSASGGAGGITPNSIAYTPTTIAEFLGKGWMDSRGAATEKVKNAIRALELIEKKMLKEDDFKGMGIKNMEWLVRKAEHAEKDVGREKVTKTVARTALRKATKALRAEDGTRDRADSEYNAHIRSEIGETVPDIDTFARQLASSLGRTLSDESKEVTMLKEIIRHRSHLSDIQNDNLVGTFENLIDRAENYLRQFKKPSVRKLTVVRND